MTLRQSLVLSIGILAVLCLATLSEARAQDVEISIETIESDQFISGHVRGLEAENIPRQRVVVYVHTDIWYIHPYAGQGEGLSWAAIRPDGKWVIETVRRKFAADKLAAVVVNENYPVRDKTRSLELIPSLAITINESDPISLDTELA